MSVDVQLRMLIRRLVARLVDLFCLAFPFAAFLGIIGGDTLERTEVVSLFAACLFVYEVALIRGWSWTLGKRIFDLSVVPADGAELSFLRVGLRTSLATGTPIYAVPVVGETVGFVVAVLVAATVAFSPVGIHDRMARTRLVEGRALRNQRD